MDKRKECRVTSISGLGPYEAINWRLRKCCDMSGPFAVLEILPLQFTVYIAGTWWHRTTSCTCVEKGSCSESQNIWHQRNTCKTFSSVHEWIVFEVGVEPPPPCLLNSRLIFRVSVKWMRSILITAIVILIGVKNIWQWQFCCICRRFHWRQLSYLCMFQKMHVFIRSMIHTN